MSKGGVEVQGYSRLESVGDLYVSGTITTSGSMTLGQSLFDSDSHLVLSSAFGQVTISGNLHVSGDVTADGSGLSAGGVTGSTDFFVDNELDARGVAVNTTGHLILSSSVGSQTTVSGNFHITGDITADGSGLSSTSVPNYHSYMHASGSSSYESWTLAGVAVSTNLVSTVAYGSTGHVLPHFVGHENRTLVRMAFDITSGNANANGMFLVFANKGRDDLYPGELLLTASIPSLDNGSQIVDVNLEMTAGGLYWIGAITDVNISGRGVPFDDLTHILGIQFGSNVGLSAIHHSTNVTYADYVSGSGDPYYAAGTFVTSGQVPAYYLQFSSIS